MAVRYIIFYSILCSYYDTVGPTTAYPCRIRHIFGKKEPVLYLTVDGLVETLTGVRAFKWTQRVAGDTDTGWNFDDNTEYGRIKRATRQIPESCLKNLVIFESEEFTIPTQVEGVAQIKQIVRNDMCS